MTGGGGIERTPAGDLRADVAVVGAGLVGLAAALACADRGLSVLLLVDVRRGESSPAAAGILSPGVRASTGPAGAFAVAARDRYPDYLAMLEQRSGIAVPLNRLGALELALSDEEAEAIGLALPDGSEWLEPARLAALEPALAHGRGAALHPLDGAVNNLVMLRAMKAVLGKHPYVRALADAAVAVEAGGPAGATVHTRDGSRLLVGRVVLAAGAWASQLQGLPRPLPVVPLLGQMLSVAGSPVRHVTFGAGGYLVPRGDGRTYVGATEERVTFDASTSDEGIATVRAIGARIAGQIGAARMLNGWAGLRPMTPDALPILGADPAMPSLLYACGHSRNGVLLAPLTGEVIGALAAGEASPADIGAFGVERFD